MVTEMMTVEEYRDLTRGRVANRKYYNRPTTYDDIAFDSQAERDRYIELRLLEKAERISDLRVHPPYLLQEKFTDRNGVKHQAIFYVADFEYIEDGITVVEDVKGYATDVFKLKKKMFLYKYPELDFRTVAR